MYAQVFHLFIGLHLMTWLLLVLLLLPLINLLSVLTIGFPWRPSERLFLSQHKYILDVLGCAQMLEAKAVSTLISVTHNLGLANSSYFTVLAHYRALLGFLQYLPFTHPHIVFFVNKLAQFSSRPTERLWSSLKQVLHYLKGMTNHEIFLSHNSPLTLHAYSYIDWGKTKMIGAQ